MYVVPFQDMPSAFSGRMRIRWPESPYAEADFPGEPADLDELPLNPRIPAALAAKPAFPGSGRPAAAARSNESRYTAK
jgi:hypothetical protein